MSTIDTKIYKPNRVAPSATQDVWNKKTQNDNNDDQKMQIIDTSGMSFLLWMVITFSLLNYHPVCQKINMRQPPVIFLSISLLCFFFFCVFCFGFLFKNSTCGSRPWKSNINFIILSFLLCLCISVCGIFFPFSDLRQPQVVQKVDLRQWVFTVSQVDFSVHLRLPQVKFWRKISK